MIGTGSAKPVKEILVGTDFSEASAAAVRVAHAYARAFGARLHVFHVTWPDEYGVTELLAQIVEELGATIPVTVASARGDAADEIVAYARLHGVNLIVVGTHGRTGFSRTLLGSVAERIMRTAPCAVLTVPAAVATPLEEARVLPPSVHRCLVCSKVSGDLVCEPCRARIRGEALYGKQRDERAGRV